MSYTGQAPPLISEEIESLLKENYIARICSHNKDGTIHAVPVGYRYMNNQIVIVSIAFSRMHACMPDVELFGYKLSVKLHRAV